MLTCNDCKQTFQRKGHYQEHLRTAKHGRKRSSAEATPIVVKKVKPNEPTQSGDFEFKHIYTGLKDVYKIYRASFNRVYKNLVMVAAMLLAHIIYVINTAVAEKDGVKAHLRSTVKFFKPTHPDSTITAYFLSRPAIYLQTTDTTAQYKAAMVDIGTQLENFTKSGSGWVVQKIEKIDLYINQYTPIRGKTYCKLPKPLRNTRAIVNVRNMDNHCFKWCVYAALYPVRKNRGRVAHYRQYDEDPGSSLSFEGVELPMALTNIPKFEQLNSHIAINVFGYGENGMYPLQQTTHRDRRVINLLLLTPDDAPAHYCLIADLGKLLFAETNRQHRMHVCNYCLCAFHTQQRLDKHLEYCTVDKQRVVMPKDPILKFRNVHRQLRAPYVLYADFECYNEPNDDGTRTHVPNSYGMLGVRRCCQSTPSYETPTVYRGTTPVNHFLDNLLRKGERYVRSCNKEMKITDAQQRKHDSASMCYLCSGLFWDVGRHRDHCHACGKYRGATHPGCNLTAATDRTVTVFFHILKKYGGHLVMEEIGSMLQECTAKSMEDYLSFTIKLKTDDISWKIRFVDSFAHLSASLETLVRNLPKEKLRSLHRFTKHPDLLCQKGFYPYDKVTGPEVFGYPGLFPIEDFYNTLTKEGLSLENYQHARKVYEAHAFTGFGQYHDLYLLTDVLLLSDVFENFRDFMLEHYGLDPAHYITLPSLSWDALMKMTGQKLELLEDPDMYQFFHTGIRGGISVISHRHAEANNPYLPNHNSNKPTSYIMYMDANNLYGHAMLQPLPVGEFEWVGEMESLPNDEYGYVLEVDLEYPAELHESHNDYPLAAEKMAVPKLSPYCEQLQRDLQLPDGDDEKLIPSLLDKEKYIIHHENLKQCLDLGLKLKKIHRGIRFREKPWMAKYIEFNTTMRRKATTAFEKDMFKLLNNAVFGKNMENVFDYIDVRLTADPERYQKLIASSLYEHTRHFKNDLHAVLMKRETVVLNKPIYTGFSVLELSKAHMYNYHYKYMVPTYDLGATNLF